MKSLEIFSYTVDTVVDIGKQMAHFETIYYYVLTIDFMYIIFRQYFSIVE